MSRIPKPGWRTAAAAVGVFILGGAGLMFFSRRWQLVHPPFLAAGVIVLLLVVAGIIRVLRTEPKGRSRGNNLGIVVLFGIFGYGLGVFGWLPALNAILDGSRGQERRVEVRSRYHSRRSWSLYVAPWDGASRDVHIRVNDAIAEQKPSHVIVTTHDGALGFEWMSDVRIAP